MDAPAEVEPISAEPMSETMLAPGWRTTGTTRNDSVFHVDETVAATLDRTFHDVWTVLAAAARTRHDVETVLGATRAWMSQAVPTVR
jgi:hypothetical protein